jgi:hypothetical protein
MASRCTAYFFCMSCCSSCCLTSASARTFEVTGCRAPDEEPAVEELARCDVRPPSEEEEEGWENDDEELDEAERRLAPFDEEEDADEDLRLRLLASRVRRAISETTVSTAQMRERNISQISGNRR